MNISVVICTYTEKRWDTLVASISSVQRQSMSPFEIIVVSDNNPALATRLRAQYRDITVAENDGTRGISAARNVGVALASGDIVAFIDDDAIAAPDWLTQLARHYEDRRVLGVGGNVLPEWGGEEGGAGGEGGGTGRPQWFPVEFDWVVGCSYRGLPQQASPVRNFIGCNMSFRREVFPVVGGFQDTLGRGAAHPAGCEETDLCIRIGQLLALRYSALRSAVSRATDRSGQPRELALLPGALFLRGALEGSPGTVGRFALRAIVRTKLHAANAAVRYDAGAL